MELLSTPETAEPTRGVIGEVAALERSREADKLVESLTQMRGRAIAARRLGTLSPTDADIIPKFDERIKSEQDIQQRLDERRNALLIFCLAGIVPAGLALWIIRAFMVYRQEQLLLQELMRRSDVTTLCSVALNPLFSERVRSRALARIDSLGTIRQGDLALVEELVGQLYSKSDAADKTLAVQAAALTRTLSNRLRHRMAG